MPAAKRSRSSRSRSRSRSVAPTQRMDTLINSSSITRVPPQVGMVMPKYICTVKYNSYQTILTIPGYFYYNLNSIFRCDAAIAGSAMAFTQLNNML